MKKNGLITAIIICAVVLVFVIGGMFVAINKYAMNNTSREINLTNDMVYTTLEEPTSIYQEDSENAQIIMQVQKGASVKFLGIGKNGFYRVSVNGAEGYVRSDNLVDTTLAAPTPEPTPEPTTSAITSSSSTVYSTEKQGADQKEQYPVSQATNVQYTMYVCNVKDSIYLRTAGSEKASVITTIPLGHAVGYIDTLGNGFYKISYNGYIGYSKAQYLTTSEPHSYSGRTYMTVVGVEHSIYLRRSPSEGSSNILEIPVGATVEYLGDMGNGFYKIRYQGYVGYGTAAYLR